MLGTFQLVNYASLPSKLGIHKDGAVESSVRLRVGRIQGTFLYKFTSEIMVGVFYTFNCYAVLKILNLCGTPMDMMTLCPFLTTHLFLYAWSAWLQSVLFFFSYF